MSTETQLATDSTDRPDRDVTWGEPTTFDGVTFASIESKVSLNGDHNWLRSGEIGYILDGLDDYLAEHGTTEIEVPQYYSRFDQFEGHPQVVTATVGNRGTALGIERRRLEAAIRFASGGGGFRHSDVTVTATDTTNYVVEYGENAYLVAADSMGLPEEYDPDTYDVRGFDVPEDKPAIREALERVIDTLERFDVELIAYDGLQSGKHVFVNADGRRVKIRGNELQKISNVPTDPEDVKQSYTIETEYEEEYDVSWDNVEYDVGDEYDDWYHDDVGIVMGYQLLWEDPRTSSRASLSGKIKADATYYVLRYVERDSYARIKIKKEQERLAEFRPENEDYNPFATPGK